MPRGVRKIKTEEELKTEPVVEEKKEETKEEMVSISKAQLEDIQSKLKMLYAVADKGRIFNYESQNAEKQPLRVKLSLYGDGIIVGWRTMRDELVKHPTTGSTVGENQEYEVIILDHENKQKRITLSGYPAFSNARYNERVEAEIVSKSEAFDGEVTYDVKLQDGRVIKLGARFVN